MELLEYLISICQMSMMCDNEELITYNYYLMIFLGDKIFEAVVLESLKKSEE